MSAWHLITRRPSSTPTALVCELSARRAVGRKSRWRMRWGYRRIDTANTRAEALCRHISSNGSPSSLAATSPTCSPANRRAAGAGREAAPGSKPPTISPTREAESGAISSSVAASASSTARATNATARRRTWDPDTADSRAATAWLANDEEQSGRDQRAGTEEVGRAHRAPHADESRAVKPDPFVEAQRHCLELLTL